MKEKKTMETTVSSRKISYELAEFGRRLHRQGLVIGNSGNISARLPGTNTLLIKPSGVSLKSLKPEELVVVDLQGNKVKGELAVSIETPIHTAIYRTREDVQAVVHTHPPTATAFGIAKTKILPLQIEMFSQLPDGIPVIPFETTGSKALAEKIQKKIVKYDAVILENHGLVTVGSTLESACDLNLMVEEAAKVQFMVMSVAGKTENLASLKKKFKTPSLLEQNIMKDG